MEHAVEITQENFRADYEAAFDALPNSLKGDKLNFFSHEDILWAYPKPEFMFEFGTFTLEYVPNETTWKQID